MGCGCAERMRKHVLPLAGYEYKSEQSVWVKGPEFILDAEVEKHHTKLVLSNPELFTASAVAVTHEVRKRAVNLSKLLNKEVTNDTKS